MFRTGPWFDEKRSTAEARSYTLLCKRRSTGDDRTAGRWCL